MNLNRRTLIKSLVALAAPAIVRPGLIMPVKALPVSPFAPGSIYRPNIGACYFSNIYYELDRCLKERTFLDRPDVLRLMGGSNHGLFEFNQGSEK